MRVQVTMDVAGRHINETLVGTDADDILAQAKAQVEKELGWKGLFLKALTPMGFAQKAIQLHNQANGTHYEAPQSAEEFLRLGEDLGYVTVLSDQ